jgi:hypothetical protein
MEFHLSPTFKRLFPFLRRIGLSVSDHWPPSPEGVKDCGARARRIGLTNLNSLIRSSRGREKVWLDEKSTTCSNLDEVQRISTKLRLPTNIETPGSQFIETRRLAGGHKVSRIGCDEVWNSQTHSNCKEYDLFEIRRSHLGNPGVVVGSEARFLLQRMNLALHLRHLVV